ncbi:MAG: glycosyltransferase family 9 protein, partial [Aeromonas salmonicida]
IAAALNRPLIGVYGSTSPLYTPPLAYRVEIVHTDIECRPCFKRTCKFGHLKCLIELMPEQVIEAGRRLECAESPDQPIVLQVGEPPRFVSDASKRSEPT